MFVPSSIDITYHDVIKIVYNPGNGSELINVSRPVLPPVLFQNFYNSSQVDQFTSPRYQNVSITYRASSQPVTYNPTITALYGDMTRIFYNLSFTVYPNSLYDLKGIHLLAASQTPQISGGHIASLIIENQDTIVNNIISPY